MTELNRDSLQVSGKLILAYADGAPINNSRGGPPGLGSREDRPGAIGGSERNSR
ncbi:MAG TPA: hypothetical protein VLB73_00565 [Patescibacteria group bacterium]|nr:hypothetical protein [Patescibacteria group bacterium]